MSYDEYMFLESVIMHINFTQNARISSKFSNVVEEKLEIATDRLVCSK